MKIKRFVSITCSVFLAVLAVLTISAVIVWQWSVWEAGRPVPPMPRLEAVRLADQALAEECTKSGESPHEYIRDTVCRNTAREQRPGWFIAYSKKHKRGNFVVVVSDKVGVVHASW